MPIKRSENSKLSCLNYLDLNHLGRTFKQKYRSTVINIEKSDFIEKRELFRKIFILKVIKLFLKNERRNL